MKCVDEKGIHDQVSNQRNSKIKNDTQGALVHVTAWICNHYPEVDDVVVLATVCEQGLMQSDCN